MPVLVPVSLLMVDLLILWRQRSHLLRKPLLRLVLLTGLRCHSGCLLRKVEDDLCLLTVGFVRRLLQIFQGTVGESEDLLRGLEEDMGLLDDSEGLFDCDFL